MSEHERIRILLPLAASGDLSPRDMRRVDEHVARCAACRKASDELAALASSLRALPTPQPPAELVARVCRLGTTRLELQRTAAKRDSLPCAIGRGELGCGAGHVAAGADGVSLAIRRLACAGGRARGHGGCLLHSGICSGVRLRTCRRHERARDQEVEMNSFWASDTHYSKTCLAGRRFADRSYCSAAPARPHAL